MKTGLDWLNNQTTTTTTTHPAWHQQAQLPAHYYFDKLAAGGAPQPYHPQQLQPVSSPPPPLALRKAAWDHELMQQTVQIVGLMLQSDECRKRDKTELAKEAQETAEAVLALFGKSKPTA